MIDFAAFSRDAALKLAHPLVDIFDQRNLLSYLGAALFVVAFAIVVRLRRGRRPLRLRAAWRLLSKRTVWLHRSARLDYKLYLVNMPLMAFVLGFFIVGEAFWIEVFGRTLAAASGPAAPAAEASWPLIVVLSLVQLLALDLGYWLGHAAMHGSELLWQFHKLHHSAEVMTPATEYRQHPVELVLMPSMMALTTGLAYALTGQWFGAVAAARGAAGFNLVAGIHILTFHHLRHSHIDMPFTGTMGVIFHSPAHHRIHHSDNPAHFNRNLGYVLSIWDWMAGTLHIPRPGERPTLGVGAEGAAHDSVARALWVPLRDAGAVIARKLPRTRRRLA